MALLCILVGVAVFALSQHSLSCGPIIRSLGLIVYHEIRNWQTNQNSAASPSEFPPKKPLTKESQCRMQVGEANNFMTTHFQQNWLQNSCHVSNWQAPVHEKCSERVAQSFGGLQYKSPHMPNLCTYPRATLGVHSHTRTPLFLMMGHRVWGYCPRDSCNAISTYPTRSLKEKSVRADFFA